MLQNHRPYDLCPILVRDMGIFSACVFCGYMMWMPWSGMVGWAAAVRHRNFLVELSI